MLKRLARVDWMPEDQTPEVMRLLRLNLAEGRRIGPDGMGGFVTDGIRISDAGRGFLRRRRSELARAALRKALKAAAWIVSTLIALAAAAGAWRRLG